MTFEKPEVLQFDEAVLSLAATLFGHLRWLESLGGHRGSAAQARGPAGDAHYGGIDAQGLPQVHASDHQSYLEGRKSDFHAYACVEAIAALMDWQLQEIISAVQRGLLGLTCSD